MRKRYIILIVLGISIALGYLAFRINSEIKQASTILHKFKEFEDSFKVHSKSSDDILKEQYAKKHDPKALILKINSAEIVGHLETTKIDLIKMAADKYDPTSDHIINRKNVLELKEMLQDYKNFINTEFAGHTVNIDSLIPLADEKEGKRVIKWETKYFEHSPLAGVVTVLTYLQNQVRTVEQEVLNPLE